MNTKSSSQGRVVDGLRYIQAATTAISRVDPDRLQEVANDISGIFAHGGRLFIAGNGGSAAQAQHFAAELVGQMLESDNALPATAFSSDTTVLTAIANDYGYAEVFGRQVQAQVKPVDGLFVLTASGASENIIAAIKAAHELGARTYALTGPEPNAAASVARVVISVDADSPAHIQEAHLVAIHLLSIYLKDRPT